MGSGPRAYWIADPQPVRTVDASAKILLAEVTNAGPITY